MWGTKTGLERYALQTRNACNNKNNNKKYVMVKKISEKPTLLINAGIWNCLPFSVCVTHRMCSTVVFHTCMECVFLTFTPITFSCSPFTPAGSFLSPQVPFYFLSRETQWVSSGILLGAWVRGYLLDFFCRLVSTHAVFFGYSHTEC